LISEVKEKKIAI